MRKHQYAQVIKVLQALNGAHGELRKAPGRKVALKLLADCRNLASQTKQFIADIEGNRSICGQHQVPPAGSRA